MSDLTDRELQTLRNWGTELEERAADEIDKLREQLALAETVRASQVAGLVESMASERHRAFLLAERVRVLEETLQSIEHDSKYFGPSELGRQARAALKGASHE